MQRAMKFVILFERVLNCCLLEGGSERFVFSKESNSRQSIPLSEIDRWGWVFWFQTNDRRFNLRWWPEVVLSNLHQKIDSSEKLCVDAETTVKLVTRFSDQSMSKFSLEHQNCATKLAMEQKFEDEWRWNLVWHVGDAKIKEGKVWILENVSDKNLEFRLHWCALYTLLQLRHHSGINLARDNFLRLLKDLHCHVSSTRTDLQNNVSRSNSWFVNHRSDYERILEYVLTKILVKNESYKKHEVIKFTRCHSCYCQPYLALPLHDAFWFSFLLSLSAFLLNVFYSRVDKKM